MKYFKVYEYNRLSYRMLVYVLICSSVFTLLSTISQLYFSYRSDLKAIESSMKDIENSHLPAISKSVFHVDNKLLTTLLDGVLNFRDIQYIKVIEKWGDHEVSTDRGDFNASRDINYHFPIAYQKPDGKNISLGTMYTYVSLDEVYSRLWDSAIIFLISNLLKTLIALSCIFIIFQMVLSRHIIKLARDANSLDVNTLTSFAFSLDRRAKQDEPDELDVIINAFNGLIEKIKTGYKEREVLEEKKKKMEQELMRSHKMEAIGNLAGGIAHDFNNILSSIIGFTELALDETPKGTVMEDSLQEVYSAGKRAKDLVRQILAFARQSDEKLSPIQPGLIAKEVLQFIRSTIPTTIEIRQDMQSDAFIMGNATQVHQVLMNLCTNAAHAMEESGGVLEVCVKDRIVDKDARVDRAEGDCVEIRVSDTGVGIAPEIIGSIFEPYFTTKEPGEGTGMGLAMTQGVVESYGGKITVDSRVGNGTTFTIYLPVTKKRSARSDDVKEKLPTGTERILFVDDEPAIAKMGGQLLGRLGYAVTTRTSSAKALELFRREPDAFDLVITDMTMPDMTGDKLAAEVMHIRPEMPVILCTGYSKRMSDETAAEIGIRALAYKPIVKADLAKAVRKVLNAGRSEA